MDHNKCPLTLYKVLLNIIGGKCAISNVNYYYYSGIQEPLHKQTHEKKATIHRGLKAFVVGKKTIPQVKFHI